MKETNKIKLPLLATVSLCFCVVAVGVGVMFQNEVEESLPQAIAEETEPLTEIYIPKESQSVTSPQTESFLAEISDDGADAPDVADTEANATTSTALAENDPLAFVFPVEGEIVLPYSVETAIFDPTLAQYRTNDSVSLSAVVGAEVFAAEDGVVAEIQKDEQRGTSLVVSHADGWLTTYSQLAADITVSVGETVSKGQKLGTVSEPTKYTVALGGHLQFAMEQDGESKDPETVVTE